ncbi:MAG: hypothetical protein AB7K09_02105 [Planctomycetota bacterium]
MRVSSLAGLLLLGLGTVLVLTVAICGDRPPVQDLTIRVDDSGSLQVLENHHPVRQLRSWAIGDVAAPTPAAGATTFANADGHGRRHRRHRDRRPIDNPLTIVDPVTQTVTRWAVECRGRHIMPATASASTSADGANVSATANWSQPQADTIRLIAVPRGSDLQLRLVNNGFEPDGELNSDGAAVGLSGIVLIAIIFLFSAANLLAGSWKCCGAAFGANLVAMVIALALVGVMVWGAGDTATPAAWSTSHGPPAPGFVSGTLALLLGLTSLSIAINRVGALLPPRRRVARVMVHLIQWPTIIATALFTLATFSMLARFATA